jgi:hypothetical protein
MISPTPACRAASMMSVRTCDTNPRVGMAASDGSLFIAAAVPRGSVRPLLRSKMTSDGARWRISASAASRERAKLTGTPSWPAVVLILDVNIKSSTIARIMSP